MQFLAAVIGISYTRFHYAGVEWWRDHMLICMVLAGKREKSLWRRSDLDIVLLQLVLCATIYGQWGQNVAPLENLAYIVA